MGFNSAFKGLMHCTCYDMLPGVDRSSHNIFFDPLTLEYGPLRSMEKPVSEYQLQQRHISKEHVGNSTTAT